MLLERAKANIEDIKQRIKPILEEIKKDGDKAVIKYSERFDGIKLKPGQLRVSRKEIKEAFERTDYTVISAIKQQIRLSKKFAKMQLREQKWKRQIFPGLIVGQKTTAIESVGLYVPGGTAPLPTVMQILAVPAKLAGVKRIVACTPPRENIDVLLVAAELSGVDEIYRVGGIQAIGAMAYGTGTIPKVQKIVGPGNVWVTAAKELRGRKLFGVLKKEISDGKPFLGICLGMQLLFEGSEEATNVEGLGIFKGKCERFRKAKKVPQIGWNRIDVKRKGKLFRGIPERSFVYFVNLYCVKKAGSAVIAAETEYGEKFVSAVEKGKN